MARSIPQHTELVNYKHAVAGHDGTLSDVDGELFVKPCTPAEVAFYEATRAEHPAFARYIPTYLGTLSLDQSPEKLAASIEERANSLHAGNGIAAPANADAGPHATPATSQIRVDGATQSKHTAAKSVATDANAPVPPKGTKIDTDLAVVLENTSHGFVRPNILDVKLGVRLYADYAREEKKVRFDRLTQETTHRDFGFRIGGMRTWQGEKAGDMAKTPAEADAKHKVNIDAEGYRIYDKNFGRFEVTGDNVEDAFRSYLFCPSAGIDRELGTIITRAFEIEVGRILDVLEHDESRMYSASLLFVYEGDGHALRRAIDEAHRQGKNGIIQEEKESALDIEADSDSNSDSGSEAASLSPRIYSVKMIDFAHSSWTPGQGTDENQLLGVRSLRKILGRIADASEKENAA